MQIVECVPNFSEGRNKTVIDAIANSISSIEGVELLHIDSGYAANRTVYTFVGEASAVAEAAFKSIETAVELIDMSRHSGEHPRQGACDVMPLIPISGITMDECVELARELAMRVGNELNVPIYCYEKAAYHEDRVKLENCRAGEYETLITKLYSEEWKPDFGFPAFNEEVARSGATTVGARGFLIAVNFNLNTKSAKLASKIASKIRENGSVTILENGEKIAKKGYFNGVKALGWYIEEFSIAQVTVNITDISSAPLHEVFDKVCEFAHNLGLRVTGTEIIGLLPKYVLLDAGIHFLKKQGSFWGLSEKELIDNAIKTMGIDQLAPYNPKDRIIEYLMDKREYKIATLSLREMLESPILIDEPLMALFNRALELSREIQRLIVETTDENLSEGSINAIRCREERKRILLNMELLSESYKELKAAKKLPEKDNTQLRYKEERIKSATEKVERYSTL